MAAPMTDEAVNFTSSIGSVNSVWAIRPKNTPTKTDLILRYFMLFARINDDVVLLKERSEAAKHLVANQWQLSQS